MRGTVRKALQAISLVVFPSILIAQDIVPKDWIYRLDGEQKLATGQEVGAGEWRFAMMPPGWHVTTTERGVTLVPRERTISGRGGIEAELFLFPKPSEEPFGLILETEQSQGAPAAQLQFLVRRDGMAALVASRAGTALMLVPWKGDTNVKAHSGGVVKYVLRVMHEEGVLSFAINGTEMFAVPAGGEEQRMIPGLRVGPGLNLHVSRYDLVTPLAPPRKRTPPQ